MSTKWNRVEGCKLMKVEDKTKQNQRKKVKNEQGN